MSTGALTTYSELADVLQLLPVLVREKRRLRGLSLRQAAKEIGVSFNTVTRFERGEDAVMSTVVAVFRWLDQPPTVEAPRG